MFVGVLAVIDLLIIGPTQFVNGLTSGAIYALIALGYTMVYGIIELINFAHGDVFMVGVFASIFVLDEVLGQTGSSTDALQVVLVLAVTFAFTMAAIGLLGVVIERIAYRPLRNAPRLAPLLTAIGVSFILQNIIQIMYGPSPVSVPQVIPPTSRIDVGGDQHRRRSTSSSSSSPSSSSWPAALREPDADGPGDALDGPGPGSRRADGRRHQPHDRR